MIRMVYIWLLLCFLFSGSLYALETDDGYLLEGEKTDYSRYRNREYTQQIVKMRGTVVDKTKVFLFWEKIPYKNVTYTVIRNTKPLNTYNAIKSATVVARISGSNQLLDTTINNDGLYYYGILTKAEGKKEDIQLIAGKSYITRPFSITGYGNSGSTNHGDQVSQERDYAVYNFRTVATPSSVKFTWKNPDGFSGNIYIYASSQPIEDSQSLQQSRLIAKVTTKEAYLLTPKPQGRVYFCILLENRGTLHYLFNNPGNCTTYFPTGPTEQHLADNRTDSVENNDRGDVNEDEDSNNNNDIDLIVRSIYRTENYDVLEQKLKQIVHSSSSPRTRARAIFFIGRVRVEKGEYRRALKLFYRSDVQKYFKEESRFWQDYCLSQLN